MQSYEQYRMTDYGWIGIYQSRMGADQFKQYVNLIYKELMAMKVGETLVIESTVKAENRELFIKIVCMFIQEGNPDYEFSSNYKIVKRNEKATLVYRTAQVSEGECRQADS